MNPKVFAKSMQINLKFMQKTGIAEYLSAGKKIDAKTTEEIFYDYLAVSHAFLSQIRITLLFPVFKKLDTPFLDTLKEIEVKNGQMTQTQIRLLNDLKTSLTLEQRRAIIARNANIVSEVFTLSLIHI